MRLNRIGVKFLVLAALLQPLAHAGAAETNTVRLAVGPFFAPPGNTTLEKAAANLPDLLTVSLSQQDRFQLVERNKVNAVRDELHLNQAGLTSAATMLKLGRILSCDWLVSGSFATAGTNTQIWVKVIDTQSGVLLDLEPVPYRPDNFSMTTGAIGDFLARTRSRSRPHEFIALGKFQDQSVSTTREDWSPRLIALIEKQFIAAGYGVVEREAVAPIFTEYQFQAAGLTGDATNRVKLTPAFWIVDGGCKWFRDTEDKLSVTLRIQKMGSREQLFSFTKLPGNDVEKAVVDTIRAALGDTNSITPEQAQAAEEKMRSAHLDDLAKGRGEPPVLHYSTNQTFITVTGASGQVRQYEVDPSFAAARQQHANEMIKSLQQAILLNPNDMMSKLRLGMGWYGSENSSESKQGGDLLEEVAASGKDPYALRAKNWLSDVRSGKISLKRDPFGNLEVVTHGQPASMPVPDTHVLKVTQAGTDKSIAPAGQKDSAGVVARSEMVKTIPANLPVSATLESSVGPIRLWQREIFMGCGTTVQCYNLDTQSAREIILPMKFQNPISAIEVSENYLWLGSEEGLVRVSTKDGTSRVFGEKDGLPAKSITALRRSGQRLFIGTGNQQAGAMGYLDLITEKFTGLMSTASVGSSWAETVKHAPNVPVRAILTRDGNNFWISSDIGLQHLDLSSQKWSLATSGRLLQVHSYRESLIAANGKFLAIGDPSGGYSICMPPDMTWTNGRSSKDFDESYLISLATDAANPDYLWMGASHGRITLLDTATGKFIINSSIANNNMVEHILTTKDKIVFIIGRNLYCLDRSTLDGGSPVAARPAPQPATEPATDLRTQFLRQKSLTFLPVQFQKDANGDARLQRLDVKAHIIESGESRYCGFQFTVPPWLDGDLVMMYALAKSEQQKSFSAKRLDVTLIPEQGDLSSLQNLTPHFLVNSPSLKAQLPYTRTIWSGTIDHDSLKPGKTYGVAFEFEEAELPDIAFLLTVDSTRGKNELGSVPAYDSASSPVVSRTAPASAEALRSAVEAAVTAKSSIDLKSLIYWQGISDAAKSDYQDMINGMLYHEPANIKLEPLPPSFTWTNSAKGITTYPNVPLLGLVKVNYKDEPGYISLPYGQIGNGFYISANIEEPEKK